MNGTWVDIKGYEGLYQLNELGQFRSLDRIINNHSGFTKKIKGKILKGKLDKDGYSQIDLSISGKSKTYKKHRLILSTFKPTKIKLQVNHINGIKDDNRLVNLEWCTNKENTNHAIQERLKNDSGENSKNSKLTTSQVIEIKYQKFNISSTKLSKMYNISRGAINNIKLGKTWKHI